ncbi:MAG: zinc ribbon domain-containing protein [Desulfobacteraceae bacterium]|jgi:putative FmdB family regulatory protein
MPIYEIQCQDCDYSGEVLVVGSDGAMSCPSCGSQHTTKLMSATSSMTGRTGPQMPGPQDTACCGSRPGEASNCAGPGSCCGQR